MKVHILNTRDASKKSRFLMRALYENAPIGIKSTIGTDYMPCDVLVLYGLGGSSRIKIAKAHRDRGLPVISFDLGYWERNGLNGRKWRVSFNSFHPQQYVMNGLRPSAARWKSAKLPFYPAAKPGTGPIMLVGNAPKSQRVGAAGWTAKKARQLREKFPNSKILYRPKPNRRRENVICDAVSTGPVENDLARCSLVVCRHSNVAVDACMLGIPVVCEDGAAAAIYPHRLDDHDNQPDDNTRREFLERLAWWQWSIEDIRADVAWPWLLKQLDAI